MASWIGVALLATALGSAAATEGSTEPPQVGLPYRMWKPGKPFGKRPLPPKELQGNYRPPEVECAYQLLGLTQPCYSIIGSRIPNAYLSGETGRLMRSIEGPQSARRIADAPADPTGRGYFSALCAQAAGEAIHVRVTGVRSLLSLRVHHPLAKHLLTARSGLDISEVMRRDPYLLEDPLAYYNLEPEFEQAPPALAELGWQAFEVPLLLDPPTAEVPFTVVKIDQLHPLIDYPHGVPLSVRGSNLLNRVKVIAHLAPGVLKGDSRTKVTAGMAVSRYGYFWRGLRFAYDREHRVAGRELVVMDLASSEVLATQRSFMQWNAQGALQATCPESAQGEQALTGFLQRVFPLDAARPESIREPVTPPTP